MAATSSFTEGSSVFGGQANLLAGHPEHLHRLRPGHDRRPHHLPLRDHRRRRPADHQQGPRREEDPAGQVRHPREHAQLRRLARHRLRQHGPRRWSITSPSRPRPGRRRSISSPAGSSRPTCGRSSAWPVCSGSRRSCSPTRPTCSTPRKPASTSSIRKAARPSTPCGRPAPAGRPSPWARRRPRPAPGSCRRSSRCPRGCWSLPIGLRATDRFINALRKVARVKVPAAITEERGRLVDMITDMHQYFYDKRVALWGDPDQLVSLVEFLADLDMRPVYVVTGTPGKRFEDAHGGRAGRPGARGQGPPRGRRRHVPHAPMDQATSRSICSSATPTASTSPATRTSPSCVTASRSSTAWGIRTFPRSATSAAMRLMEMILDALLDHKDRNSPEESFELVM